VEILYGKSADKGHVMATATKLSDGSGLLSLHPERLRRAAQRANLDEETFEDDSHVVLVSRKYPEALLKETIPGLVVVGLALAEPHDCEAVSKIPIVGGLGEEILHSVNEDDLLIVDSSGGKVIVDPDAVTIAAYQEDAHSKRQVDIGTYESAALTTDDGRLISLSARVNNYLDIYMALESGVDGLFVTTGNELLPSGPKGASVDDQVKALADLSSTIGRVPLFLQIPLEQIAFAALAQAACKCSLHVVIDQVEIVDNLITQLKFVQAGLSANNIKHGPVQFDALLSTSETGGIMIGSLTGFSGVVVSDDLISGTTENLVMIGAMAQHANKPVVLSLPKDHWHAPLEQALMLGFTGFVAYPDTLAEVKQAIRVS